MYVFFFIVYLFALLPFFIIYEVSSYFYGPIGVAIRHCESRRIFHSFFTKQQIEDVVYSRYVICILLSVQRSLNNFYIRNVILLVIIAFL